MNKKSIINIIKLQKVEDNCNLVIGEIGKQLPFEIKRVYYITNATPGLVRGCHAHKELKQVMMCIQGSVKIVVDSGESKQEIILDAKSDAIMLDSMTWHEMHEMNEDTILFILASNKYSEEDYINDYQEYIRLKAVSK